MRRNRNYETHNLELIRRNRAESLRPSSPFTDVAIRANFRRNWNLLENHLEQRDLSEIIDDIVETVNWF